VTRAPSVNEKAIIFGRNFFEIRATESAAGRVLRAGSRTIAACAWPCRLTNIPWHTSHKRKRRDLHRGGTKNQGRDFHRGPSSSLGRTQLSRLALARFETRVLLIDEVDTALAAHDLAVFVARLRGLE
jgi:hypothetical protein